MKVEIKVPFIEDGNLSISVQDPGGNELYHEVIQPGYTQVVTVPEEGMINVELAHVP